MAGAQSLGAPTQERCTPPACLRAGTTRILRVAACKSTLLVFADSSARVLARRLTSVRAGQCPASLSLPGAAAHAHQKAFTSRSRGLQTADVPPSRRLETPLPAAGAAPQQAGMRASRAARRGGTPQRRSGSARGSARVRARLHDLPPCLRSLCVAQAARHCVPGALAVLARTRRGVSRPVPAGSPAHAARAATRLDTGCDCPQRRAACAANGAALKTGCSDLPRPGVVVGHC